MFNSREELDEFCELYCDDAEGIIKNYTMCTEIKLVDCKMYPKRIKELKFLVPMTVILLIILLTGLVGNLSVCIVIKKHPNMRTETNVYLFSLAVSDILLLVFGLAPELWYYWQMYPYIFGDVTCRISSFLASTATWASALTVVAFSIERYMAICYHKSSIRSRNKKRVAITLWAVWTISVALSLPELHAFQVVPLVNYTLPGPKNEIVASLLSTKCTIPKDDKYDYHDTLLVITLVLFFVIPMVLLALMYVRICIFVRRNRKEAQASGIENSYSENNNTKAITMMVAVVVLFFVCGAPYHLQRITTTGTYEKAEFERTLLMVTGLFYYASAAANPILYNIWCKRYRQAFMDIIPIGPKKQKADIKMYTSAKTAGSKNSTRSSRNMFSTRITYTTQVS